MCFVALGSPQTLAASHIHSNVSFILVMIGGLILCPIIAYVLWQIYRVHSNIKGFRPMVKIFNDKKGEIFNISDLVSNRLRALEGKFSSLVEPLSTVIGAELALPCTSTKPAPPPQKRLSSYAGFECHPTDYTGNCEGHGQTRI